MMAADFSSGTLLSTDKLDLVSSTGFTLRSIVVVLLLSSFFLDGRLLLLLRILSASLRLLIMVSIENPRATNTIAKNVHIKAITPTTSLALNASAIANAQVKTYAVSAV